MRRLGTRNAARLPLLDSCRNSPGPFGAYASRLNGTRRRNTAPAESFSSSSRWRRSTSCGVTKSLSSRSPITNGAPVTGRRVLIRPSSRRVLRSPTSDRVPSVSEYLQNVVRLQETAEDAGEAWSNRKSLRGKTDIARSRAPSPIRKDALIEFDPRSPLCNLGPWTSSPDPFHRHSLLSFAHWPSFTPRRRLSRRSRKADVAARLRWM